MEGNYAGKSHAHKPKKGKGSYDRANELLDRANEILETVVDDVMEQLEIDFDEERIDIIGQNGNNGEHYEVEDEDKEPHLTINCEDGVHVIPVALLEDVVSGRAELTEIENWEPILKKVLAEWLSSLNQK